MKANRTLLIAGVQSAVLAALLASCASPPPPPAPRPTPRPQPSYTPPPPPRPVQPAPDWRDRPITPGIWRWGRIDGASSARFGEGSATALEIRCDRTRGNVLLIRPGAIDGQIPVTVVTTSTARSLTGQPLAGAAAIVVPVPVRDPLLDAIIFSRGRFAVEARGHAPVYAPTWPEIARVVEDCR